MRALGMIDYSTCCCRMQWQVLKRLSGSIDFVAAQGRYHKNWQKWFFLLGNTSKKRGLSQEEDMGGSNAAYILKTGGDGHDCQYSTSELLEDFDGYSPDARTIQKNLWRNMEQPQQLPL